MKEIQLNTSPACVLELLFSFWVYYYVLIQSASLGSFGHFQASRSGVHKGGLEKPIVKAGFVATRISVRSLY